MRQVLIGQLRDGNVVQVDFVTLDQMQQQVQRPGVGIELHAIVIGIGHAALALRGLRFGHAPRAIIA
jgi:hypothetical protein